MGFFDSIGEGLSGIGEGLSSLFSLGQGDENSLFSLNDLLKAGIQVGGNILTQDMANDAQLVASEKALADKLKYEEALLELKKKYGLLGGGGGGGSGAGMYAAQTQRAATLANLYNEMAKQRLLGASQVGEAYKNLGDKVSLAALSRAR